MTNGINNLGGLGGPGNLAGLGRSGGAGGAGGIGATEGKSFSDTLKEQIEEVARLQKDASQAVENLATGQTDNVTQVMTAMQKSDLAFKTLLAIRGKLMEAYDEIKSIGI